jgi:hypothetical protein
MNLRSPAASCNGRRLLPTRGSLVQRQLPWSLAFALFVISTGCASAGGGYRARMDSWLGTDVNGAIQQFGPPTQTFRMPNGQTMYSWTWRGGTLVMPTQYGAVVATPSCQVTFTADSGGQITSWQSQGNCR